MRRRAALYTALCALLAFLCCAAGCTSIFSRSADESATPTPPPQETVPQRGGDLFVAIPENVSSLDPFTVSSEDLVNFLTLIYEAPFKYDATGRLHPQLVDYWEVSEDGREFRFRIRDDVYFSDGTQLTARDVYDSAQRALEGTGEGPAEPEQTPAPSPDDAGDAAAAPSPTRQPSYASYANRFRQYGEIIEDIRLDDDSIVIRTSEPGSAVLDFMTFPVAKSGGSASSAASPGTGPYYAVSQPSAAEQIVLEVNTSWWGGDPYIQRIVGVPATGQRVKIDMQQTSLLDFVTTNALNAGNYDIAGKSMVIDYMTNYFDCLVPNLSVPGLQNADVRRAISEAIDRREILSTVLLNHGVPSDLPIAPDSYVMDARFRSNQRDIQAALALLGAAGYRTEENGSGRTLEISLIVPDALDSTYKKEAARAIRKQLEEVFIEVTVEELPQTEYQARLSSGDYDIAYCTYYLSSTPDLAFMLTQNGSGNYNGFSDTQVDQALEACAEALTEDRIIEEYAHLQELLNVHMPVIGLYFRMNSIVCDEGIGGITGVREETVFADIASWYTMYTTRSAGSAPTQTVSATSDRQTEPRNYSGSEEVSGTG